MSENALGARVKALRIARMLRQEDLAHAVGKSKQLISQIERGQVKPGAELIHLLDRALEAGGELVELLREAKVPMRRANSDTAFSITAHLFFPATLAHLEGLGPCADPGHKVAVYPTEEEANRVHIYGFGVAVLHEVHHLEVQSLTELAQWRSMQIGRKGVAAAEQLERHGLPDMTTLDPYCLAVFVAHRMPWAGERCESAVKVLSCLSLLSTQQSEPESHEARILRTPVVLSGAKSFGLPKSHIGWAAWSGVAIYGDPVEPNLLSRLVDLEIWVQSLWCYADQVARTGRAFSGEYDAQFLRAVRRDLLNPGGTESTPNLLLREAIIETSRIRDKLDLAIEALNY